VGGGAALEPLLQKDGFHLVRCRQCCLIFVSDPPTDEGLARLYSFEGGYHVQLQEDAWTVAHHQREARRNLATLQRYRRSGRLLDIGCSTGLFLRLAVEAGWEAQGIEYSADSAEIARSTSSAHVVTGTLRPGTFHPGTFDVVTMWDVIEHLPDPRESLRIAVELLAPGGMIVLKTPNCDGLYPQVSLKFKSTLHFWGHPDPPGHLFQFSVRTLTELLRRFDLQVTAVKHSRIPLRYSFGEPNRWFRSVKWAAYCAGFIPLSIAGPWFGQGDDVTIVAKLSRMPAPKKAGLYR